MTSAMDRTLTAELNFFAGPDPLPAGETLHYYADFSATTNVRLAPQPHRSTMRGPRPANSVSTGKALRLRIALLQLARLTRSRNATSPNVRR